jgi:hypothetical protein
MIRPFAFSSPGSTSSVPSHGREEVEVAEFLRELHRLVDHALLLVVVAHLDEAGQREVLAQRMPLEAVVGEDAAQVRMAGEQDAVHVVGLALEPVGAGKISMIEGTGVSSSVSTLTRMRWFWRGDSRW